MKKQVKKAATKKVKAKDIPQPKVTKQSLKEMVEKNHIPIPKKIEVMDYIPQGNAKIHPGTYSFKRIHLNKFRYQSETKVIWLSIVEIAQGIKDNKIIEIDE